MEWPVSSLIRQKLLLGYGWIVIQYARPVNRAVAEIWVRNARILVEGKYEPGYSVEMMERHEATESVLFN